MKLSKEVRECVSILSLKYLGKKHDSSFSCVDFVRSVYREVDINIPILGPYLPPPVLFNITKEDLSAWEHGYVIFLTRCGYVGKRTWTHLGITLPKGNIIHSSHYFDGEVSVNSQEEIFSFYQYVPSF
jgi:cell wall-associated NlpC family hydrolase